MPTTLLEPGRRISPGDLEILADGERFELIDGRLEERPVSLLSSWVNGELLARLRSFVRDADLGWVLDSETGYRCFAEDPERVRRPDVSFIRKERLTLADLRSAGFALVAPDLAVEVVSRHDTFFEVQSKAGEFLSSGTRLVWIVEPRLEEVYVHRADGSVAHLTAADTLAGEDVLPGFPCSVRDLFPRE